GKLVDDEELREAMKDSGIGTPATRAAIIERLIQVGYVERDGRALTVMEKGLNVIRLLGEHALTSPGLTGEWEHRLANIETGTDCRRGFMGRSGRTFRARLALQQDQEGRWRVEFDEPWAREGARAPSSDEEEAARPGAERGRPAEAA